MATKAEIRKALTALAAAYPNFDLPEQTAIMYQRALADMDYELLKAACLHCISMLKFFPTVAEIRDAAVDLCMMAEKVPSAAEAWGLVLEHIRGSSSNFAPELDPHIEAVVRQIGGWFNLRMSENVVADRARFMDAWTAELKQLKTRRQMLPEVRELVDRQLEAGEQIKQLASRLDGKHSASPQDGRKKPDPVNAS